MTMILSTKRTGFAAIAADSLVGRTNGTVDYLTKIVRHERLPLAFAYGGLMNFALNMNDVGGLPSYLKKFAETIKVEEELIVSELADKLTRLFQEAMNREKSSIQIFIALVKNGQADIGVQVICDEKSSSDKTNFFHRYYQVIPEHLSPYKDKASYFNRIDDPQLSNQSQVVHRLKELIEECIKEEQTFVTENRPPVIGGNINIVVVAPSGAKII